MLEKLKKLKTKIISGTVYVTSMSPIVYALIYISLIPVYAAIYSLSGEVFLDYGCDVDGNGCPEDNFWTHLYYSAVTITTLGYGDITPTHGIGLMLGASESVFGVILIGLFLNALSNKHSEDAQKIERDRLEKKFESVLEKIENENRETINHLTGGDSFSWIQIGSMNNATNSGTIVVIHQGRYPLYEVNARIVDLNKFNALQGNFNIHSLSTTEINLNIGNLIPELAVMKQSIQLGHPTAQNYNVFFSARNGTYTQEIRMRKVQGDWKTATRVTNSDGDEIFEQVDKNYPLVNGAVDW
ncbi:TPA: hypothetical protein I7148_21570 [Vibrio vulnificus]|nr:hypothetical protein [Vibrio vulnificus]